MIDPDNKYRNDYRIDKTQVRHAFNRATAHYDRAAILQREIGDRMLERLDLIRINPEKILDIGSGTGKFTTALAKRYKKSQVIAIDIAPAMLNYARRHTPLLNKWRNRQQFICGDAEFLPVADDSADMIFSNLVLQWCNDLDQVFSEFRRVLKPGGLLMFSTFGPDTLVELRNSWHGIDHHTHVNAFIDMHDIGDAIMRAQFSDPVMDMDNFTLTYRDVKSLMHDLKRIGAHNVTAGRAQGLMGKTRFSTFIKNYEQYRCDGLLPASYEIVYGHAWMFDQPATQKQLPDGKIAIPVSQIQGLKNE